MSRTAFYCRCGARLVGGERITHCCPDRRSCGGKGYTESDFAPGTYYPCVSCNPNWSRTNSPAGESDTPKKQEANDGR